MMQIVTERLSSLARSNDPITVGPWISEVGYELLYWIPFLHWAVREYEIDVRRLTIISRGGVKQWYGRLAQRYVDIFDHMGMGRFRQLGEERSKLSGKQKHMTAGHADQAILDAVKSNPKAQLLHPELMYNFFDGYWSGAVGFERFRDHVKFHRMTPSPHEILKQLPSHYVAVKFYSRPSMPWNDDNIAFVNKFTRLLAEQTPVVFLQTGVQVDEHNDFVACDHPNVVVLPLSNIDQRRNLLIQSAVVSHASQVFCTYGGFSYLPLFYGVPAVGFFSHDKHFMKIHGRAAYLLANKMHAPLSVIDTGALGVLTKECLTSENAAEAALDHTLAGS